jgi:hypothetical protein
MLYGLLLQDRYGAGNGDGNGPGTAGDAAPAAAAARNGEGQAWVDGWPGEEEAGQDKEDAVGAGG